MIKKLLQVAAEAGKTAARQLLRHPQQQGEGCDLACEVARMDRGSEPSSLYHAEAGALGHCRRRYPDRRGRYRIHSLVVSGLAEAFINIGERTATSYPLKSLRDHISRTFREDCKDMTQDPSGRDIKIWAFPREARIQSCF
jgi:hypothetical protein